MNPPLFQSSAVRYFCLKQGTIRGGYRIPCRRGRQLLGGAPTYKLAGFSQKLHEIKTILVHRGGAPLDPPLTIYIYMYCNAITLSTPFHFQSVRTESVHCVDFSSLLNQRQVSKPWSCLSSPEIKRKWSVYMYENIFQRVLIPLKSPSNSPVTQYDWNHNNSPNLSRLSSVTNHAIYLNLPA